MALAQQWHWRSNGIGTGAIMEVCFGLLGRFNPYDPQ
jgi:hypothetical protein